MDLFLLLDYLGFARLRQYSRTIATFSILFLLLTQAFCLSVRSMWDNGMFPWKDFGISRMNQNSINPKCHNLKNLLDFLSFVFFLLAIALLFFFFSLLYTYIWLRTICNASKKVAWFSFGIVFNFSQLRSLLISIGTIRSLEPVDPKSAYDWSCRSESSGSRNLTFQKYFSETT